MRKRKKHRSSKGPRLLASLLFAIIAVFLLASGQVADRVAPEPHTQETIFIPAGAVEQAAPSAAAPEIAPEPTPTPTETPGPEAPAETEKPAETEQPAPELDEAEVEMLACGIYCEAGGNACSDKCRYMVGDVMLNRVNDPRFPDTLEEVLTQKGQYGTFYWTGIVWPERAQYETERAAVERAYETARALLSGEHSELYGAGYIWQAEFPQGTDGFWLDGIYFGR